jgi:hypothetical protein
MSLLRRLTLLVLLAIVPILAVEITNQVYLFNERVAATHDETERLATMFDRFCQISGQLAESAPSG